MQEEVHTPSQEPTSDEASGSKGAPDGLVPKEKFDAELGEAIKRRDSALKRAREAEARLAQIEEETLAQRKRKAESEGNTDEQKKLFQVELEKLRKEREMLSQKLSSLTLETKVKSKLSTHTDYLDDAWKLLSADLSVEQDEDGEFKPVLRSNPYASVDDYIKNFFETKPYLAKNQKREGTGVLMQIETY